MNTTWHALAPEETGKRLGVDPRRGLDADTVRRRRDEDGPNRLQDGKRISPWRLLAGQFLSPLIALLLGAAVIAALLGEWIDAGAIAAIVLLNAVVGFLQEYRAERAMAALRKLTAPMARVLRDGRGLMVPATEVVRGDILILEAGDQVAADARLLTAAELRAREAALTGESEPVDKRADAVLPEGAALAERANLVFMGTAIVAGAATAVVTATGMRTEIGRIARLLEDEERAATPLQRQLADFGRTVFRACLALVGVVMLLGYLRGTPGLELFLTAASLAVAAVPEGLPAVVTIALALGVSRMARRKALIRRLHAVETLGAAGIICTDKTGTLTTGEMTTRELHVAGETFRFAPDGTLALDDGAAPDAAQRERLALVALIHAGCNNATLSEAGPDADNDEGATATGDPTEVALLAAARRVGLPPGYPDAHPVLGEHPFDSDGKRHGVFRRVATADGPRIRYLVNGAPDVVIDLCDHILAPDGPRPLGPDAKADLLAANADMGARALRVLGSAWRDLTDAEEARFAAGGGLPDRAAAERGLVFAGLAGLQDPPRPEAAAAIARCAAAGIRVVMITGDHPRTAQAVAAELGIMPAGGPADEPGAVMSGAELDTLDDEALRARVGAVRVYARVTAAHKLRIVRALKDGTQRDGADAVVAMTGDGVNDAPALKGSDIGIAMGRTGTEVTKQTADVILADDNFATIVAAVEEGRGVYFNIRKTLQYLLAGNAGELLVMLLAIAWGWSSPLLPVHLLWINLITDGLPALVLAADGADASLMRRKPRRPGAALADRAFLMGLLGTGLLTAAASLAAFAWGLCVADLAHARSLAFDTLVFSEVFRALAYHSDRLPFWRCRARNLLPLWLTLAGIVLLQAMCHHLPALERILYLQPWTPRDLALIVPLSLVPLLVLEARKVLVLRRRGADAD